MLAAACAPMVRYGRDESGASASEYALMLLVLAGCGLVLMRHLGADIGRVARRAGAAMARH
jgi:Flp pilus assembly pilin Flp